MILFLSSRYAFSTSKALRSRSWRIMLTVALSLTVVTVVISLMNFLQTSRFDSIRDIRSFDCTLDGDRSSEIRTLLPSATVFAYGEGEAISESGAYLVRYIDSSYDGGLEFYSGSFSSLAVPYSFYLKNGWREVTLSTLKSGKKVTALKSADYAVSGIYHTALGSEFDDTMLFLPLSEADENVKMKTAVKKVTEKDMEKLEENGYRILRWQDAESSLYGAFLIEKTLMYAVLSLLFVIIAVSLKSAVALFSYSREKEMAELEILGLERKKVNRVVLFSFLRVVFFGILLSLPCGCASLALIEVFSEKSELIVTMKLSLPWGGFLFFALFMTAATVILVANENRRRGKRELHEVIHAE